MSSSSGSSSTESEKIVRWNSNTAASWPTTKIEQMSISSACHSMWKRWTCRTILRSGIFLTPQIIFYKQQPNWVFFVSFFFFLIQDLCVAVFMRTSCDALPINNMQSEFVWLFCLFVCLHVHLFVCCVFLSLMTCDTHEISDKQDVFLDENEAFQPPRINCKHWTSDVLASRQRFARHFCNLNSFSHETL